MGKYIKSHSNYVLKKKHQNVSDGVIYERDATTIGGLDQFAKGQTPIYKSSNFIITINQENDSSRLIGKTKWAENENSEYWSLDNITITSGETTEIELKRDYRKLQSFAYYGSCAELIRASITDIIRWFPGELYVPRNLANNSVGYNISVRDITEWNISKDEDIPLKILGDDTYKYAVDNPFDIDIFTTYIHDDEIDNPLRYFANEGYLNYDIIDESGEISPVVSCTVSAITEANKVGDMAYLVTVISSGGTEIPIACYLDNSCQATLYLVSTEWLGWRIRPNETKIKNFYKSLDFFEKTLLNRDSRPIYTARFEILRESMYGMQTDLEDFTFPTTYGNYNLSTDSDNFQSYLNRLAKIGEYYDEHFSDNLYRSMTHEAIKNFDWSFTREYNEGDEDEYVEGGTKVQKLIRLFGREFDEIRQYIEGIKEYNSLSYYDGCGTPDYVLTDILKNQGWDIRNIYPLKMSETTADTSGNSVSIVEELNNNLPKRLETLYNDNEYERLFGDDLTTTIKPYDISLQYWCYSQYTTEDYYGYYFTNDSGSAITLSFSSGTNADDDSYEYPWNKLVESRFNKYSGDSTTFKRTCQYYPPTANVLPQASASTRYFPNGACLSNKIKEYTTDKEYTMLDVNNHFMRMLLLNSRQIMAKKGTIEGLESMLAMFGLKSKRWCEGLSESQINGQYGEPSAICDYDVSEHVAFTNGIIDGYIEDKSMYQIDWYNYTKTIYYDTDDYRNGIYNAYQGLPVTYYYTLKDGEIQRILYPNFKKDSIIDGNPYFQMYGGWLDTAPFVFDKENKLLLKNNDYSAVTRYLTTETIKNTKSVDDVSKLINIQPSVLHEGDIYHVKDLSQDYIVIEGEVFELYEETTTLTSFKYFNLRMTNGVINVGDLEFSSTLHLSNPYTETTYAYENVIDLDADGNEITQTYTCSAESFVLEAYNDGDEFKCYLLPSGDTYSILIADEYGLMIKDYSLFFDGHQLGLAASAATNYFYLSNVDYCNEFSTLGWSQLSKDSERYRMIERIQDYFEGNNPHGTEVKYDNGYEYISYFTHLFKEAEANNDWDDRCYIDDEGYQDMTTQQDRGNVGFVSLVNKIEDDFTMDNSDGLIDDPKYKTASGDTKVHYFGNLIRKDATKNPSNGESDIQRWLYQSYEYQDYDFEHDDDWYEDHGKERYSATNVTYSASTGFFDHSYTLLDATSGDGKSDVFDDDIYLAYTQQDGMIVTSGYGINYSAETVNGITDQIMNTKVIDLTFFLKAPTSATTEIEKYLDSTSLEEIKYIDTVIMSYVTQMIPSGTILRVTYQKNTP